MRGRGWLSEPIEQAVVPFVPVRLVERARRRRRACAPSRATSAPSLRAHTPADSITRALDRMPDSVHGSPSSTTVSSSGTATRSASPSPSPAAATISGDGVSPAASAAASGSPPGSAAATASADAGRIAGFGLRHRRITRSTIGSRSRTRSRDSPAALSRCARISPASVVGFERQLPGEDLVEHQAERVDVAA